MSTIRYVHGSLMQADLYLMVVASGSIEIGNAHLVCVENDRGSCSQPGLEGAESFSLRLGIVFNDIFY